MLGAPASPFGGCGGPSATPEPWDATAPLAPPAPRHVRPRSPTPWRCHDRLSDVSKVVTAPFSHSWAEHSRSWGLLIACARSEHGAEPQDARMGAEAPLPKVNQYRRTDMPAAGAAAPGKQEER